MQSSFEDVHTAPVTVKVLKAFNSSTEILSCVAAGGVEFIDRYREFTVVKMEGKQQGFQSLSISF